MSETTPTLEEATALVSWELVAEAAGISESKMLRIARDIVAGRRTEWLGANVEVRIVAYGRERHHHFVIATLPAAVRAELESDRFRFHLAWEHASPGQVRVWAGAERTPPGAELDPADFLVLHEAVQSRIAPELFGRLINSLTAGGPLLLASRARFELVTDYMFGYGLRSQYLREIGPDYAAYLEAAAKQVGLGHIEFWNMLKEIGGSNVGLATLSGQGFLKMLMHLDQKYQLCLLPPRRHYMNRAFAGQIHRAAYQLNRSYAEHLDVVIEFGGGCYRVGQLDERGARRVLAHYYARGYLAPEPAPRVSGAPGFITQAQANLIWKLWHDFNASNADVSEAALASWLYQQLGVEGGPHALTAAGAGRVLDYMLAPLIALRLKAVEVWAAGAA